MDNKYEYSYDVEDLDKVISDLELGIRPIGLDDHFLEEVRLRSLELQNPDGNEDLPESVNIQEKIKAKIEKKRREATKEDVHVETVTEEELARLRSEMEESIVRFNPHSQYHKTDEELYDTDDRRLIQDKLKTLKPVYYNQADYVAAIKIIQEAVKFSLANDYPLIGEEEAIRQFNTGEIKFTFSQMPKLMINYNTQITDPHTLAGVVSGEIELKNKNEITVKRKEVDPDRPGVEMPYRVIGPSETQMYLEYHNKGYNTPVSLMVKQASSVYNRYSMPGHGSKQLQTYRPSFNWGQPDAGMRYYEYIHGKKYSINNLMNDLNKSNDGLLNNVINTTASNFFNMLKYPDQSMYPGYYNTHNTLSNQHQVDNRASQIEQEILKQMRMNNSSL